MSCEIISENCDGPSYELIYGYGYGFWFMIVSIDHN